MQAAVQATWTDITDGTAVGPTEYLEIGSGAMARVSALWSDHEGVVVDLEVPDIPLTSGDVDRLTKALHRAINTPAPVPAT